MSRKVIRKYAKKYILLSLRVSIYGLCVNLTFDVDSKF